MQLAVLGPSYFPNDPGGRAVPGRYTLAIRPLVEGAQSREDYGVFW